MTHPLVDVLNEMDTLLDGADEEGWRRTFQSLVRRIEAGEDLSDVARDIKSMFAGMGSLTDLVIYRHGQVVDENDRFRDLRSLLHRCALDAIR